MRHVTHRLATAVLFAMSPIAVGAQTTDRLDDTIRRLGSADYAKREAAQRALTQLTPREIEPLRAALRQTFDEEVRSRLQAAIDELEINVLLNPTLLTVDMKEASLGQLLASLNAQLGEDMVHLSEPTRALLVDKKVSLSAKNQTYCQIMVQINQTVPLYSSYAAFDSRAAHDSVTIQMRAPGATEVFLPYTMVNGFAAGRAIVVGSPAAKAWTLECVFLFDPRVRIARSQDALQIESAIDQDGNTIHWVEPATWALGAPLRAAPICSTHNTFMPAPALQSIKELRARLAVDVLEKEFRYTVDLEKLPEDGFASPAGKIAIKRVANGDLKVTADRAPPAPGSRDEIESFPMVVVMKDEQGAVLTSSGRLLTEATLKMGKRRGTTLEFFMAEKTRRVSVPIVLKDISGIPAHLLAKRVAK